MKKVISAASLLALVLGSPSVLAAKEGAHWASGDKIVDVTNGTVYRGVSTPNDAWGYGNISFTDGEFSLESGFEWLNDPQGDDFYEGWLVQQSPFKFISTWVAEKQWSKYVNDFTSTIDYTNYDFYVLTLEPNDGDPAPADHILEGNVAVISANSQSHNSEWNDVTIDLTGKNFEFSQDKIEVYEGDRVTINFESTGGFHDWGVDEFDAWTKKVNPGEVTSVTFTADKVWSFEFYCSVGNHRAEGMLGWFIVKEREEAKNNTQKQVKKIQAKELTATQKALRVGIKARLSKIKSSSFDPEKVLKNLDKVRASLTSRGFSADKIERYNDILDAVEDVLHELISEK